ncbi:nickel-dependent lactate racemase [Candidatus Sumerlaeota bacterium]|nr:nickel-dependent lactate racemase [Candidatus Sumerlaeota bacterium]
MSMTSLISSQPPPMPMHTTITLSHGTRGFKLEIPDGLSVCPLEAAGLPALTDPRASLEQSLRAPLDTEPLQELARGKTAACVLIPDQTRPCPLHRALPALVSEILHAGLRPDAIEVLVATGLHVPPSEEGIRELVGPDVSGQAITLRASDARDPTQFKDLTPPPGDAPIHLHRDWVGADLRVVASLVEPHLLAGYSGGAKMILPGIADLQTIRHAHRPEIIAHPRARAAKMTDNPMFALARAGEATCPAHFHLALAVDRAGDLAGAWAGSLAGAHAAAIAAVGEASEVHAPRLFDAAITSGGGSPTDRTLYQSLKGFCMASRVVRPGGPLWLLTPAGDGIGSPEFETLLGRVNGPEAFFHLLESPGFFSIDQWMAQHLFETMANHPLIIHAPGLDAAWLRGRGMHVVGDVAEGWQRLRELAKNPNPAVAILSRGAYTLATTDFDPAELEMPKGGED